MKHVAKPFCKSEGEITTVSGTERLGSTLPPALLCKKCSGYRKARGARYPPPCSARNSQDDPGSEMKGHWTVTQDK